MKFQGLIVV